MLKRFWRKNRKGAALVETALCLPALMYLIFFVLEAIRIGIFQSAIDRIAFEATFDYCARKDTNNFDTIITRCKPSFLDGKSVRFSIVVYPSLKDLYDDGQFGLDVTWPANEQHALNITRKKFGNNDLYSGDKPKKGAAFELTCVCNYKFAISFVSKILGKNSDSSNGKLLIWSRVICVCN